MPQQPPPFDLNTDPPENIYSLTKLLFERLLCQLPPQERMLRVKKDLRILDKLIDEPLQCVDASTLWNAGTLSAYLYRFLLPQVNAVRWSFQHVWRARLVECADGLRMLSVGGGIGSELLGAAVSLSENSEMDHNIGVTFLEEGTAWETVRQAICAAVACCGHRTRVCSINLREDISTHRRHVSENNLICFIHALKIMNEAMVSNWIPNILSAARQQATIMVVDFQGPRLARLCEIISKAGFESCFHCASPTPHGLESVPSTERTTFMEHFKDNELQLGSLPLLHKSSLVHIFQKKIHHTFAPRFPVSARPPGLCALASSMPVGQFGQAHISYSGFNPERRLLSRPQNRFMNGSKTEDVNRNPGVTCNGEIGSPPSPRESGEIESGEEQDTPSPGGMEVASSQNVSQPNIAASGTHLITSLANLEHLPGKNDSDSMLMPSKACKDTVPTAELTIGVQLFAKYKVGSQVFRANTFSEAKKRAVVDTSHTTPDIKEADMEDKLPDLEDKLPDLEDKLPDPEEKTGVLEWVECRQGRIKRPKYTVPEGFQGKIQCNKEPSQIRSNESQQEQMKCDSPRAQPWQMTLDKHTVCSKIIGQ